MGKGIASRSRENYQLPYHDLWATRDNISIEGIHANATQTITPFTSKMLLYNVAPPQISSPVMSHPLLNSVRVLIFYFAESLSQGVQEGVRLNCLYGGVRSNSNL